MFSGNSEFFERGTNKANGLTNQVCGGYGEIQDNPLAKIRGERYHGVVRIEYVTHASLLLKSEQVSLLTDPFYFFDDLIASFLCHFPYRDLEPDHFGHLDYVFCSHIHDDHCHKETMLALKDRIGTLLLPAGKPDFADKLRAYGFETIVFLENEVTQLLTGGVSVTNYHDKNGVDTALVIEMDGKTVLHQNDCRLDRETFERMAERFKIDYAFVPHTGNQELYPLLLPRPEATWRELSRAREEAGVAEFVENLRILKPRLVIPYSFTVAYHNRDQIHLNGYNRTTPPEFCARVTRDIPNQPCVVIQPGDVIDTDDGAVTPYAAPLTGNSWGHDLLEYMAFLETCCQESFANREFAFGSPDDVHDDFLVYCRERVLQPFPEFMKDEVIVIHVTDGRHDLRSYFVDVGRREVFLEPGGVPFLEITIPASLVHAFLSRRYDSFMILYSYRITFQLNAPLVLSDEEECAFYVNAAMAVFDYELYLRELAGVGTGGTIA